MGHLKKPYTLDTVQTAELFLDQLSKVETPSESDIQLLGQLISPPDVPQIVKDLLLAFAGTEGDQTRLRRKLNFLAREPQFWNGIHEGIQAYGQNPSESISEIFSVLQTCNHKLALTALEDICLKDLSSFSLIVENPLSLRLLLDAKLNKDGAHRYVWEAQEESGDYGISVLIAYMAARLDQYESLGRVIREIEPASITITSTDSSPSQKAAAILTIGDEKLFKVVQERLEDISYRLAARTLPYGDSPEELEKELQALALDYPSVGSAITSGLYWGRQKREEAFAKTKSTLPECGP